MSRLSCNDIEEIKQIALRSIPRTDESPVTTRNRHFENLIQLEDLIPDLGNFSDSITEGHIGLVLDRWYGRNLQGKAIIPILKGKSGDRVFQIDLSHRTEIAKVFDANRSFEFITELSMLFYIRQLNLSQFEVAEFAGLFYFTEKGRKKYVLIQTYLKGETLGQVLKQFLIHSDLTAKKAKRDLLNNCFYTLGQSLNEIHTVNRREEIVHTECRFRQVLEEVFIDSENILRNINRSGIDVEKYHNVWTAALSNLHEFRFPAGHMLLDPQFENIVVLEGNGAVKLGIIDTSTSFHSTETDAGGNGLPALDVHLLTKVYPRLRVEKGKRLESGSLSRLELTTFIKKFRAGYFKTEAYFYSEDQSAFLDLVQCSLYVTWFFNESWFEYGWQDMENTEKQNRWISVHFYRDRLLSALTRLAAHSEPAKIAL